MPIVKACAWPGCRRFAALGDKYCKPCKGIALKKIAERDRAPQSKGRYDDRKSAAKRGYGRRWRKARAAHLAANPLCTHCSTNDVPVVATVVDHVVPHRGDRDLFWRSSNWQGLCKTCHDAKTFGEWRGSQRPTEFGEPL